MKKHIAIAGLLLAFCAVTAQAADAPNYSPRPDYRADRCPAWGESRIATLPALADMSAELNALYSTAIAESESERTISSRSNRYIWAVAARNACGIAIGYISTGEVNPMRFWNCECYSNWMQREASR